MNAGTRLALYGAGLVVAFGAAFGLAGVIVPDSFVSAWAKDSEESAHEETLEEPVPGALEAEADGYSLSPIAAPNEVGVEGDLSFQILDSDRAPITEFDTAHDDDLDLIVLRNDGAEFQHLHPELDSATGTWSVPVKWDAAGTYWVFVDFVPADHPDAAAEGATSLTLAGTVEVGSD